MKKYIAILLSGILMLAQATIIFAADQENEQQQYQMVEEQDWVPDSSLNDIEISPYTLYLADVVTSIVKVSATQVSIRAQAICGEKVKSITVIYILQKWNGSKWVDIASKQLQHMTHLVHIKVILFLVWDQVDIVAKLAQWQQDIMGFLRI